MALTARAEPPSWAGNMPARTDTVALDVAGIYVPIKPAVVKTSADNATAITLVPSAELGTRTHQRKNIYSVLPQALP